MKSKWLKNMKSVSEVKINLINKTNVTRKLFSVNVEKMKKFRRSRFDVES